MAKGGPKPPVIHRDVAIMCSPQLSNLSITLETTKGNVVQITDKNGIAYFKDVPPEQGASHMYIVDTQRPNRVKELSQHVDLTPNVNNEVSALLEVIPQTQARKGTVISVGHHFKDADGYFFPLGHTLFWTLWGWKYDQTRIKANIDWIAKKKFDFIRILGEVGWSGHEILPGDSDYYNNFVDCINYIYSMGLRTQPTLIGGGTHTDYDAFVNRVIQVLKPHKEKIMYYEVANEYYNNFDNPRLSGYGSILQQTGNLVALSAPRHDEELTTNNQWTSHHYASIGTVHLDRDDSKEDWKWRHVRKPWEVRGTNYPQSHGEPGGPLSSVAEYNETIHLVMARATAILCGIDSWVLHNGAGIFGFPNKDRPANAWETPNIDTICDKVRLLDSLGLWSDGTLTRKGLGQHPLEADAIWTDGADHGVVRDYAITNGDHFWQVLLGIKNHVSMRASQNMQLEVIDPLSHSRIPYTMIKDSSITLQGQSKDSRGYGALIIKGVKR